MMSVLVAATVAPPPLHLSVSVGPSLSRSSWYLTPFILKPYFGFVPVEKKAVILKKCSKQA
jgi:hypothetical protein